MNAHTAPAPVQSLWPHWFASAVSAAAGAVMGVEGGGSEEPPRTSATGLADATAASDPLDSLISVVRSGGDRHGRAAQQLVEELYPTVIRIVRNHLPFRTDEEDLTQDIFMKMFQKLDQFRGESPFTHWVSRIATNTCLDALRRQKVRPEIRFADLTEAEQAVWERASSEAQEQDSAPDAPASDGTLVVEKLLEKLRPDQQVVVRMMDVEQKSVKEICNLTGWSASKVKVTAMRARRHLQDLITRLGKSILS